MGVRIVVVLQADLAHVWSKDPSLGRRILSNIQHGSEWTGSEIEGGRVVEIVDDNIQSLLIMDRYKVYTVAYEHYKPGLGVSASCVRLLRSGAKNLGYNLFRNYFQRVKSPAVRDK